MTRINVYLHFAGNCQEAMNFYQSCLGGELVLQVVGETPMAEHMPDLLDKVLHSTLTSDGFAIMASDIMGPQGVVLGNRYSLCTMWKDNEVMATTFAKMAEGGTIDHPLQAVFFGTFGELTDKFGVAWMFQSETQA